LGITLGSNMPAVGVYGFRSTNFEGDKDLGEKS
jgi:hypothetical protein